MTRLPWPALTILSLSALLPLSAPAVHGQTPSLVEDIAAGEVPERWSIISTRPLGQKLFFEMLDATSGAEPWVTDGTVAGTRMLADTCQGSCGDFGWDGVWALGDHLLWLDTAQLWSTDGTPAGTVLLTPGTSAGIDGLSSAEEGVLLGGKLYFIGCGGYNALSTCRLWRTDGTLEGTGPVPVLTPGALSLGVSGLTAGSNRVYYFSDQTENNYPWDSQLWVADAQGTRQVKDFQTLDNRALAVWQNRFFFVRSLDGYRKLWVSDGTPDGTRIVMSFDQFSGWLTTGSRGIYFVANDGDHGPEIWRSDGTAQGTQRVTNLSSDLIIVFDELGEYYKDVWAAEIGGRLLFAAFDRRTGIHLWSTTGTPESTQEVSETDIRTPLLPVGNRVFFQSYDAAQEDCEVWSFDGRAKGIRIAEGFDKKTCDRNFPVDPIRLRTFENRVYFAAPDSSSEWSAWRTDGTARGTVRLFSAPYIGGLAVTAGERNVYYADPQGLWIWNRRQGSQLVLGRGIRNATSWPLSLEAHQGQLFFTADASGRGDDRRIWSSQGSAADTSPVLSPEAAGCGEPEGLISAGSSLYFFCDTTPHLNYTELRRLDPAGTSSLVADVIEDQAPLAYKDRLWYVKADGPEIWTTDGTPAGTARLLDAGGNPLLSSPQLLATAASDGNLVYFAATRNDGLFYLWRSDGTPTGTLPLVELYPNFSIQVASAGATTLLLVNGDLWRTDGTPAGTVRLTSEEGGVLPIWHPLYLAAHNGAFYLYGSPKPEPGEVTLWRTDGTVAGTVALTEPIQVSTGSIDDPPLPVGSGARLFFVIPHPEHGRELWSTDGTPGGTSLVADISPGPASSRPQNLIAAGGLLWFTAHDQVHGRELWRTDGTAAGTRIVQDIAPEGLSSSPEQLRRGLLEGLHGEHRPGDGRPLHRRLLRDRLLLVLRCVQHRARGEGPGWHASERPLLGVLRRPVECGVQADRNRHPDGTGQGVSKPQRPFRQRGGYSRLLSQDRMPKPPPGAVAMSLDLSQSS